MHTLLDVKWENRKKIYHKIRETGSISASILSYELQLSRPTIKQNLDDLMEEGLIYENGSFGYTGGRRAKSYAIAERCRVAIGMDLTLNHITLIMVDLCGNQIYEKRLRHPFHNSDLYLRYLGELIEEAIEEQKISTDCILGVGITVPALIAEDKKEIFYGEILKITGLPVGYFGKYIPYPCHLFNDASAAGYAEKSINTEVMNAFYISLCNSIGGAFWINDEICEGETFKAGEIGHVTIIPEGRPCYCGQKGCFETYCNTAILAEHYDGMLAVFFEKLAAKEPQAVSLWDDYLYYLAIAIKNLRMLYDCKVILGGYLGAYIEPYLDKLKSMVHKSSSFEDSMDYLLVGKVKREALALGGALPFIHEFWQNI